MKECLPNLRINFCYCKINLHPEIKEVLIQLLSPIAPHLCEELWLTLGNTNSIFEESWPVYDEKFTFDDMVTIVVQVNGESKREN